LLLERYVEQKEALKAGERQTHASTFSWRSKNRRRKTRNHKIGCLIGGVPWAASPMPRTASAIDLSHVISREGSLSF
jgi:hypothetical protein